MFLRGRCRQFRGEERQYDIVLKNSLLILLNPFISFSHRILSLFGSNR
jgi:hypothetical protein